MCAEWTWVSYASAIAVGWMGSATYSFAGMTVSTMPPAFEGPPPMICGSVVEWRSGLGSAGVGDNSLAEQHAIEEACRQAARPDWYSFLTLLTVTGLLLVLFVVAAWRARAEKLQPSDSTLS